MFGYVGSLPRQRQHPLHACSLDDRISHSVISLSVPCVAYLRDGILSARIAPFRPTLRVTSRPKANRKALIAFHPVRVTRCGRRPAMTRSNSRMRNTTRARGRRSSVCPRTSVLRSVRTTLLLVLGFRPHEVDVAEECYLVDPASSHMLVSKIKPCMCKYELIQTVKLRMAH